MDTPPLISSFPTMSENSPIERAFGSPSPIDDANSEPENRFTALVKRLIEESPVDPDRVQHLADEIRSGTYQSDPWLMAGKLIGMELSLP